MALPVELSTSHCIELDSSILVNGILWSLDADILRATGHHAPDREQRDKIFERFYRAAGPKQRAISGLGMGLYIVAEIVKRHGGTITVDSEVGKGSTFTVTLPLTRDA